MWEKCTHLFLHENVISQRRLSCKATYRSKKDLTVKLFYTDFCVVMQFRDGIRKDEGRGLGERVEEGRGGEGEGAQKQSHVATIAIKIIKN